MTDRFDIHDIIMQGTIFGSLSCTTSMSQLGALAYKRGKPLLLYKDTVRIPSLGMIDDILSISQCGSDTIITNSLTNTFVEAKKLELSDKKCHRLHKTTK